MVVVKGDVNPLYITIKCTMFIYKSTLSIGDKYM